MQSTAWKIKWLHIPEKLRYGKAEKEMILQYELIDSRLFRSGLKSYKEHDFTSIVERIAVGKLSDSSMHNCF